jgi:iron complex transport system substrate-binding protein
MNKWLAHLAIFILLLILTAAPAAAQDSPFPVTIEHKYGSTTITQAPQRIVSIGYNEHDTLFALGVTPVAVRYWYGDAPNAIFPWAEDEANGAQPILLDMPQLNFEAILELEPDLITGLYSGITEEEYNQLSQIAPTITQSGEYIDFGMPWQETTLTIGTALGKAEEAEAIVERIEGQFADARAAHPEFEGKSIAVAFNYNEGVFGFYTADDPRGRFFENLGFVIPETFAEIAGDSFFADLSAERLDLLDQDVIAIVNMQFIEGGLDGLKSNPLFAQLQAVQDGRVVYFEETAENAFHFGSPLSLEFALERIVPELARVLGGEEVAAALGECEAGFRLFDHEMLATDPVCIPENPQRILALEVSALETVLFTDKELVGTANWLHSEIPLLLPELASALAGIADTGYPANLEVALLAEPDLILATDGDIDVEAGSEIAPVVMVKPEYDWKLMMAFWSEVLGTQDVYARMLANYQARIAEFQSVAPGDVEVSVIGASTYGAYLWLVNTAPGYVITDAGLSRPEWQLLTGDDAIARFDAERWILLSEERYDLADADHIFVFTYATSDPEIEAQEAAWMDAFKANPVWNALSASQANNVHYVGPYWWRSQTYLMANMVLDDLFTYLTDATATTPVLTVGS